MVQEENNGEASQDEDEETKEDGGKGPDYDYLLGMTMWSLTKEKKDELLRKRDEKQTELRILQGKSAKDIWKEDLNNLLEKVSRLRCSLVYVFALSPPCGPFLFLGCMAYWNSCESGYS